MYNGNDIDSFVLSINAVNKDKVLVYQKFPCAGNTAWTATFGQCCQTCGGRCEQVVHTDSGTRIVLRYEIENLLAIPKGGGSPDNAHYMAFPRNFARRSVARRLASSCVT